MNLNYKVSKSDKIVIFGHKGLIGSAIVRELKKRKYKKIIVIDKKKLNLLDKIKVFNFLEKTNQELLFWRLQGWGYLCKQQLSV